MPQLSVARERKRRNSRQPRQRFQVHTMAALILLMPVLATPALAQPVAKAEIVANLGHTFGQCCAMYLPGGRYLISAGTDRSVRLWDRTTGRLIRTFRGSGAIKSLAVMPDGSAVLSGTTDGAIELWETASGRLLRTLQGHKKIVLSLAVSADGGYIASASDDGTVRIWNAATGLQLRIIADHHSPVSALAFTADKPRVISGDENGMVAVHDLATGKITRKWKADSFLTSLAVTPDGSRVITGGADQLVQIWDLATGASIRTIKRHTGRLNGVAVAPDGGRIASVAGDRSIRVWDSVTGEQVFGVVATSLLNVFSVEFSPDGKQLLFTGTGRGAVELNIESRQVSREYGGSDTQLAFAIAYSLQGDLLAVGTVSGTIDLWDTATARLLQSIKAHAQNVKSLAFSQDGARLLSGSDDGTLSLSDVASGRLLHALGQNKSGITAVAFSPDGRLALSGGGEYKIQLWDTGTGQLVREIAAEASASAVAFSADARQLISAQSTGEIKVWDTASGQLVRSIGRYPSSSFPVALSRDGSLALTSSGDYDDAEKRLKLWSTTNATSPLAFAGTGGDITSVALSTDAALAVSATYIGGLKYLFWDARTGRLVSPLEAPTDGTGDLVLSPDGKRLAGTGRDGSVKVWNLETGRVIAGMFRGADQSWLTISLPHGFFAGTPEGARNISIVRGLEIYDVSQVYQSLFNPDLVSESMAGDPAGEAQNAAAALDLDKVLDSGAAPLVAFGTMPADAQAAELFTAETRITDQGGGIGRVEWRVNGVTAGVESPAGATTTTGSTITIARTLALEPGQNSIEAVAYNGRNLLASLPARGTITFAGPADTAKPKLHVLAIGIDDYVDQGWTPPGASAPVKFPRLNLAVKDATTFGADMKRAAAGVYGEVRVTAVLDKEATRQNLDRIVTQLAGEIHPRDTFVLFAAAHGFSSNGRFYLIPQDYQGGTNPVALAAGAVDQRQLQDWIANRIKARRAVILLDTCESGALVGGYTRSRTDTPASEAAVGRLHEATGRPILTAAATGKPAFEGYKGHGVFTWALLDALRNGDRNGNGSIELSELVAHVQDLVPKLSAELKGRGRAAIAVRGSTGDRQSARFGSRGEDFVLTQRLR
jgi:WD40 repeat protein